MANPATAERKWVIIDANDQVLGRMATRIAMILKGKTKPYFTPHIDCGDFVVVINAEKVVATGNKDAQKYYFHHSGVPGGGKITYLHQLRHSKPAEVVRHAVKGMLANTRLGRKQFRKLYVYAGSEHPHQAQQPQPISFK